MQIAKTIAELKALRSQWRDGNLTVSLVPTMGALHQGHLQLVERARSLANRLAVSIFVNPTQFGPSEDFQRYPRMLDEDLRRLEESGVDAVFLPDVSEIYPQGYKTFVTVEELGERLCGVSRPTHFRGVATVVLKLFNIVQPDFAVFGQKDAQQAVIIRRLVRDLNLDVEIVVCPIVREPDGLALSSRNRYLNAEERRQATVLYHCLEYARQAVEEGERRTANLLEEIRRRIAAVPLARLDYAEIVDLETLSRLESVTQDALLALAVFIGNTRLIDNTVLGWGSQGLEAGPKAGAEGERTILRCSE